MNVISDMYTINYSPYSGLIFVQGCVPRSALAQGLQLRHYDKLSIIKAVVLEQRGLGVVEVPCV